jgi:hypothetical protein
MISIFFKALSHDITISTKRGQNTVGFTGNCDQCCGSGSGLIGINLPDPDPYRIHFNQKYSYTILFPESSI